MALITELANKRTRALHFGIIWTGNKGEYRELTIRMTDPLKGKNEWCTEE